MKYKYIGTVEQLEEHGFYNNEWRAINKPIYVDEDGIYEAIKIVDNVAITVEDLTYYGKDCFVEAYRFKLKRNDMHDIIGELDPKPYIQDLIDANLVEVIK